LYLGQKERLIEWDIDHMSELAFVIVIVVVVTAFVFGAIFLAQFNSNSESALRLKSLMAETAALVDLHIESLARQRISLLKIDRYGVIETSAWDAEMQRFIDTVIFPNIFANDKQFAIGKAILNPAFTKIIDEKSQTRSVAIEAELAFSKDMPPQEFERWCAKMVASYGWQASTTTVTGDQGADVIAEKPGKRLILQCKLYNAPVGNKAVQEAFAAQHHYRANGSAVVTNSTYTPSAIALAATTGVRLLHYSDLSRLDALFSVAKSSL
jgi:restriction system protein